MKTRNNHDPEILKRRSIGLILFGIFVLIAFLSNAQTKDSVLAYLTEIGCVEPELVTKQSILECGHKYESYNARKRNNLFGLWNHAKQEYYSFSCWQESCNAYLCKIQYKLQRGENYYNFLKRIGYATSEEYEWKLRHTKI